MRDCFGVKFAAPPDATAGNPIFVSETRFGVRTTLLAVGIAADSDDCKDAK